MERIDINGLDAISVIKLSKKRSARYSAITLSEIEEVKGLTAEQYKWIRKAVLDNMNELRRAILRDILGGDVEGTLVY